MTTATSRTIRTVTELREVLGGERAAERTIALVPTMGALHDGHLSLIERACAEADTVVVSVFVNPAQFNDASDLAAYPRDEDRDIRLATEAGAAILFVPAPEDIYPDGFCTEVRVGGPLTETLEGAHRGAGHFHGVTTVVTKLLNMAGPDVAVFGAKDAQQVRVIGRLVTDLDIPVRIVIGETVREPDGLARSSRNVRLDGDARSRAAAINAALEGARDALAAGDDRAAALIGTATAVLAESGIEPEYVALADPMTLEPLDRILPGHDGLLLIAAPVGGVRLIDNALLSAG